MRKKKYNTQTTAGWSVAEKLAFHSVRDKKTGCLLWTAALNNSGYGTIMVEGRRWLAHRLSWREAHKRKIPKGKCVLHRCDVRRCIEPSHFFTGSIADNNADKIMKGKQVRGEQHGAAKLTTKTVKAIRKASGSHRAIGHRYGVSHTQIRDIRRRVCWRHV